MRLVQIINSKCQRRIGIVDKDDLVLLSKRFSSIFALVSKCLEQNHAMRDLVSKEKTTERFSYSDIYNRKSDWKILPSFDHPDDPMHCILSGTGLTHKKSAESRDKMHENASNENLTDSMKIYMWGEEEGKPESGQIGCQPEWFFKGNGTILKGHGDYLNVPNYALDGGEEPELALVYVIDAEGNPVRVGVTIANEFSDHVMEKKNYLYLAPSKLRECSIGPELTLDARIEDLQGEVTIRRNDDVYWKGDFKTGIKNITHTLENLEYHHFKYSQHRIPGQVHIHFIGTGLLSFTDGIVLEDDDEISIAFENMGQPLVNRIKIDHSEQQQVTIRSI